MHKMQLIFLQQMQYRQDTCSFICFLFFVDYFCHYILALIQKKRECNLFRNGLTVLLNSQSAPAQIRDSKIWRLLTKNPVFKSKADKACSVKAPFEEIGDKTK